MATVNTYLNFNGNTEEAFNFYKSVFGGEFAMLQRFKDIPDAGKIPAYHLFINPVIIGNGMTIFKDQQRKNLDLVKITTSSNGIVVLFYHPK